MLRGWSWERVGVLCCLAGRICSNRSGWFDTTSEFLSLNCCAAHGHTRSSAQSTTLFSAQHISLFQLPDSFLSPQAGRFINQCNSIGWPHYLEASTERVYGIFGLCGSSFSLLCHM